MKLLFIAPSNSIHSKKWIEYFLSKHDIYWVSFYKKTIDIDPRINYLEITSIFSFIRNYFTFIDYKSKVDLVHQHYLGKFSWIMIFINKKLILSPWGSDIKFVRAKSLKGFIIKKVLKKSKIITIDAEYMSEHVLKFGEFKEKIKRINFGTDTTFFNYDPLKEKQDKPEKSTYKIISLRNLEKIYCIEDLICSMDILPLNQKNKIHLDIYGDGNERKHLESLVESKGLNKIITFKGRYSYQNLPQLLKKYDLYISTSSSDAGLAASTSEAMSCGTLVLSSDNSENIYWIKGNGMLYKTNDIKNLRDKIIDSINLNFEERKNLIENARKKIVSENDFIGQMGKMEKLYNS